MVTWNADGSVDVYDETHHVMLPEAGSGGSGEGFVNITDLMAAAGSQAYWDANMPDGGGRTPAP